MRFARLISARAQAGASVAAVARIAARAAARARAMEAPACDTTLWRAGAGARVATGAAAAFAGGALVAASQRAVARTCLHTGAACGALAAPFFALREAVVVGAGVDGPAASFIAGGVAGYFGALAFGGAAGARGSALAVGVGCGVADALISAVDWRRKLYLVRRADTGAGSNAAPVAVSTGTPPGVRSLRSMAIPSASVVADVTSEKSTPLSWLKWPSWLPALRDIDEEYQELIRRREATIAALEAEQARIAKLLEELEIVKAATRPHHDAELGETDCVASKARISRA